jgi:hypothetical protein
MPFDRHSTSETGLPPIKRYITTHNEDGKAIFSDAISPEQAFESSSATLDVFLAYGTKELCVNMTDDADLKEYSSMLEAPHPGITIPGGTVLRVANFAPNSATAEHRTISLDYGIVMSGEIELVLDSGETRLMKGTSKRSRRRHPGVLVSAVRILTEPKKAGDIAIQRGTNHAWRNPSKDSWARMIYAILHSEPVKVNGVELSKDHAGIFDH